MIELLLIPYLAIANRIRGGMGFGFDLPRGLELSLVSWPFVVPVLYTYDLNLYTYILSLLVFLCTLLMWSFGWGTAMDLGRSNNENDRKEFPHSYILGRTNGGYWFDFAALAMRGAVITVPVGLATVNPWLVFAGAVMAPAYAIGWLIPSKSKELRQGTEIGEALFGAFLAAILLTTVWSYL